MISAIQWVPKGAAKRTPERFVPSAEEIEMMKQEAELEQPPSEQEEEEDSDEEVVMDESTKDNNGLPASFKMDNYDDEDDEVAVKEFTNANMVMEEDENDMEMDDMEETEKDEYDAEDLEVKDSDYVVLVANTEEDFSSLEVQIYDEEDDSLYVHHEIALPAFPLSLAWMNCHPTSDPEMANQTGNYVAVGTFKPAIEIWNLDVLDVLEPSAVLGGEEDANLRNVALPMASRRKRKTTLKAGSHEDAVLCLDWNTSHRNMLLSGSADTTVKIWDVTTQSCMYTLNHHTDKVQCALWNPAEATVIASAGFDKSLVVLDGRKPDAISRIPLPAEAESMTWNPFRPEMIVIAMEDGSVHAYDVRMADANAPLYSFAAHSKAVSGVSFSSQIPGLFATASVDKTVKLWDLQDAQPVCVTSKEMAVGELYSLSFCQDSPYILGVGGSKGVFALWDTCENSNVERKFAARMQEAAACPTNVDFSSSFRTAEEAADQIAQELMSEETQTKATPSKSKSKKKKKSSKN